MSTTVQEPSKSVDTIKWVLVFTILAAVVVVNQMFNEISALARAFGAIVAIGLALFIAGQTMKGQRFLGFAKESRTEVRKVVWPTRQETIHTTLIIFAATVIAALILWGLDSLLFSGVGAITGWGN